MTELAEMLKALAHSSRVAMVFLLCSVEKKGMTVKSIYESLRLPQPVVSRHLGILRNCGLLERLAEGQQTYYRINIHNKHAKRIADCFAEM